MFRSRAIVASLALVVGAVTAVAQDATAPKKTFKMPRESPAALVRQEIGLASVEISYARPAVLGRDLAADLKALHGAAWRFGANAATKVTLSAPAKIGGKDVAAGAYALFAFPGADSWTLALNTVSDQWGAYFYDPKRDVARFEAKPGAGPHQERLQFVVDVKDENTLTVRFAWSTLTLDFDVVFDVRGLEEAQIAEFMNLDPKDVETRLSIVQLRIKRGKNLDEALRLCEEAEQISPSFWVFEWKGRALRALGRTEEAIPLLEKAAGLARGKAPDAYCDNLLKEVAEWRKK